MKSMTLTAACMVAVFGLAGCKIVKAKPAGEQAPAADASGDDARIAAILADSYDSKLVPLITTSALPFDAARAEAAKTTGAGQSIAVTGQGVVTKANLTSRARVLEVDMDADGTPDATLQLGPVIKGSSLRDFAPSIYDFTSFRDQIEFAKLGRALNDRSGASLKVPDTDPTGKTVSFTGVVTLKKPTDPWIVTLIGLEVAP